MFVTVMCYRLWYFYGDGYEIIMAYCVHDAYLWIEVYLYDNLVVY